MRCLYPGASRSLTGAAKVLAFRWPDIASRADAEILGNARVQRTWVGGIDGEGSLNAGLPTRFRFDESRA